MMANAIPPASARRNAAAGKRLRSGRNFLMAIFPRLKNYSSC
jgi:hypothetical protein